MPLEDLLEANTAAVLDLTKAILGKPPATTTSKPAVSTKPNGAAAAPKRTSEEVMAIAVKVKTDLGVEAAKFLIAKTGAASLKMMKPASFAAFYADCESALEAGAVEGMEGEEADL